MTPSSIAHLPKDRPPLRTTEAEPFDWHLLIPAFVHETKVAIIEAMSWIGQPLSASELELIFAKKSWSLGTLSYHVRTLTERGILEEIDERAVRGARETYFFLVGQQP